MAIIPLNEPQSCTAFFQESALINLQYWENHEAVKTIDIEVLDREREGIIRALSFALSTDEAWPSVRKVVETLSPYMERCGFWETWHRTLNQAIEMAHRVEDLSGVTALSLLLARLLQRQSRFKEAMARYRQTIRLARQISDRDNEARACSNLGYFYIEQGYWHRAEVLCCHALSIFEQIDNDHGRAHTENHLGILHTRQGEWDKARRHLDRACMIWQEMDDNFGLMFGHTNLGRLFNEMGRYDESLNCSRKALDLAHLVGEEVIIGTIYMNIASSIRMNGEPAKAEKYFWRAEAIFRRYSDARGLAMVFDNVGLTYLDQGKWSEAVLYLERALKAWRDLNNKYGEIRVMTYLVEYELARGNHQQASGWLEAAKQLLNRYDKTKQYSQLYTRVEELRRSLPRSIRGQAAAR